VKTRLISFLLLTIAMIGALLLPGGDASLLRDLPAMYAHCKATEDKDLTPLDFITDHLTCFDALLDTHPPGDEQRPHAPAPTNRPHVPMPVEAFLHRTQVPVPPNLPSGGSVASTSPYSYLFCSQVFRPPLV
jgi:hypothetical protein